MFRQIGTPEIILILVVIILLFGARKLPEAAKGMGQALKIFKKEVKEDPVAPPPSTETTQAITPGPVTSPTPQQLPPPAPPSATVPPTGATPAQERDHQER